jgi:hypothetical protein
MGRREKKSNDGGQVTEREGKTGIDEERKKIIHKMTVKKTD